MYFTVLHWISVVFFILLFGLGVHLTLRKEKRIKMIASILITLFLVVTGLSIATIFALDSYTKQAKVTQFKHKRVLAQESIVFSGMVRNTGKFKIGKVKLKIKMVNGDRSRGLAGGDVFNPRSAFFEIFSGYDLKKQVNVVEKEVVIAKSLKPKQTRRFSVRMKYPGNFKQPQFFKSVSAH